MRDTLESRGVLSQLKARIRAEVFSALDDQREPRPPLSHENLLINELIREYLEFNKYRYAASVLAAGGCKDGCMHDQHQCCHVQNVQFLLELCSIRIIDSFLVSIWTLNCCSSIPDATFIAFGADLNSYYYLILLVVFIGGHKQNLNLDLKST